PIGSGAVARDNVAEVRRGLEVVEVGHPLTLGEQVDREVFEQPSGGMTAAEQGEAVAARSPDPVGVCVGRHVRVSGWTSLVANPYLGSVQGDRAWGSGARRPYQP